MYVCIFIKLHITAQFGPVISSGGYLPLTYSWLEIRLHTATTPLPATTAPGRNPTPSTLTTTLCPKKNMGTKTREMVDRLVPFQHMGKAGFSPLGATNKRRESDKQGAPWPIFLVTSSSKPKNLAPPFKPCNVLQQWCRNSALFPLQHLMYV